MKKVIFVFFLLFGIFTFSLDGFKYMEWGMVQIRSYDIFGET